MKRSPEAPIEQCSLHAAATGRLVCEPGRWCTASGQCGAKIRQPKKHPNLLPNWTKQLLWTIVHMCIISMLYVHIYIYIYIYIQIANWSPIFQCKQLKTLFSPALIINHHPSWIYLSIRKGPEENPRTLGELAISDLAWTPDVQADSYKVVPPSYKLVYKRH